MADAFLPTDSAEDPYLLRFYWIAKNSELDNADRNLRGCSGNGQPDILALYWINLVIFDIFVRLFFVLSTAVLKVSPSDETSILYW